MWLIHNYLLLLLQLPYCISIHCLRIFIGQTQCIRPSQLIKTKIVKVVRINLIIYHRPCFNDIAMGSIYIITKLVSDQIVKRSRFGTTFENNILKILRYANVWQLKRNVWLVNQVLPKKTLRLPIVSSYGLLTIFLFIFPEQIIESSMLITFTTMGVIGPHRLITVGKY